MAKEVWPTLRKHLVSIRMKILLIAFVAIAGFGGYLSFIYSVALANSARINATQSIYYPILTHATNAINALSGFTSTLEVALGTADEDLLDSSNKKSLEVIAELDAIIALDNSLATEINTLKNTFISYQQPSLTLAKALINPRSNKADIPALMEKVTYARTDSIKSFADFKSRRFATFKQALEQSDHSLRNAINAGIGLVVVILLILSGIAWFVAHAITKRVKDVAASLNEMARGGGDLTHHISSKGADEINELVSGFNLFVTKLRTIIAGIIESSHEMTHATAQITNSIRATSEQVNEQNNRTIEVATSIERMVINVNTISANANKALNVAQRATVTANDGQTTVNQAIGDLNRLATMVRGTSTLIEELGKKNAKIGGIVKSIQDITEQTNLLALNATIESARAGEHGRGFAVVAEEVRGLAQRTARSAQEIRGIIDSVLNQTNEVVSTMSSGREQAGASVEHAAEAARSLSTITESIDSIRHIIDDISNATTEQNLVANEINENVFHVSEISIETAGEAARTAESAQQLSELTLKLNRMVSQFKV